ncbi:MAG: UvrD-helicase domain-containing protein [Ignavibacteriaceae bacterium]|nr:UvrD-helicase domain-containing protein [Ignavibacteriaceae bacterium]
MKNNLTNEQNEAAQIDKHLAVTANAGSGKTFVLTERLLEIIKSGKAGISEIAAITFTDAAASDLFIKLNAKIRSEINILENKPERTDEETRNLDNLKNLIEELFSSNISTIHSFCLNLLREFPLEAKIDINFQAADEVLSKELITEAIDKTLANEALYPKIKNIVRHIGSIDSFRTQILNLIEKRKIFLEIVKELYSDDGLSESKVVKRIVENFGSVIEEIYGTDIFTAFLSDIIDLTAILKQEKFDEAEFLENELKKLSSKPSLVEIINFSVRISSRILTASNSTLKNRGFPKILKSEFIEETKRINEFYSLFKYDSELDETIVERQIKLGYDIVEVYKDALKNYTQIKEIRRIFDFEDILIKTKELFEFEHVKDQVKKKFKFLLIDEYQDTNSLQYQIFLPIVDNLKEGNLYIVGDPKQSIYAFREADLSVFEKTKEAIENNEGLSKELQYSFRMLPELCVFTNFLFSRLFVKRNKIYNEVEYNNILFGKRENRDTTEPADIHFLVFRDEKKDVKKNDEILKTEEIDNSSYPRSEAELLAAHLLDFLNSKKNLDGANKYQFSDITILCHKKRSFSTLEKVFSDLKIPYRIQKGSGFFQNQIVLDFLNLFRFVINQNDNVSLLGILRSPFFMVSDTKIYNLASSSNVNDFGNYSLWEKLIISQEVNELEFAKVVLSKLLKFASDASPSEIINFMVSETPFLTILRNRKNFRQELANFDKLYDFAIDYFDLGFKGLYDFSNFINKFDEKSKESQGIILEEDNSVKIMTIHSAKGLQNKIVYIFNSGSNIYNESTAVNKFSVSKEFGILSKMPDKLFFEKFKSTPLIALHDLIQQQKSIAEFKRLFYVAVTRAEDCLFISQNIKSNINSNSFLGMMEKTLALDFKKFEAEEIALGESEINVIYLEKDLNGNPEYKETTLKVDPKIKVFYKTSLKMPDPVSNNDIEKMVNYNILLEKYPAVSSSERISASRYATFNSCPKRYQLSFEFGLNDKNLFLSDDQTNIKYDDPYLGQDLTALTFNTGAKKGTLVHELFAENKENLNSEELKKIISGRTKEIFASSPITEKELIEFEADVFSLISAYKRAPFLEKLANPVLIHNEIELTTAFDDFYLYGIIDRLVILEDEAVVIDFKTDRVNEESIKQKADYYFNQLDFYAVLISKILPDIKKITLRLAFLRVPENNQFKEFDKSLIIGIEEKIKLMVNTIRSGNYPKNEKSCSKCIFYSGNSCISA